MLLSCSTSWSQSKDSVDTFYGGLRKDSVLISIEAIRAANLKLIQANADKQFNEQLHKLIDIEKSKNEIIQAALDRQRVLTKNLIEENNNLYDKNRKLNKQRNISIATNVGLLGVIALFILL